MLKKTTIMIACLSASMSANALENDKKKHIAVSSGIAFVANTVFDDPAITLTSCLSVGVAKEVYDEIDYGGFSEKDLLADAVGCGIGYLTSEWVGVKLDVDRLHDSYMLNLSMGF